MKCYEVVCKCGHVGRQHYIPIAFPVSANSKKEAAVIARNIPRVKHHHKDAILEVNEITYEEYEILVERNKNDEYLQCHNIQEQNQLNLSERLLEDPHYQTEALIAIVENKIKVYKKQKVKNPKKFFKNICWQDNYMEALAW